MGLFSGVSRAIHSPDFGMRLQAFAAAMNGDPNAIYRMREMQRQNAELQLRQQAAQQAQEDRNNQIWGAKESGVGNPQIAAMNSDDLSHYARDRFTPHQFGPEGGSLGTPDPQTGQMVFQRAPWQRQVGRDVIQGDGTDAAPRTVFSGIEPVPVTDGGHVYGWNNSGPVSGAPQLETQGSGGPAPAAAPTARNNPGGLRYPGSTQFRTFPTQAAGIAAQEAQLGRPQYLGTPHSVSDIVERYAPRRSRGGDNTDEQVNNYISHVSRRLGVDPNQPLTSADIPRVAAAMREVETGRRGTIPGAAARGGGQAAALRAEAQRAIAAGADPQAVAARLRQMGVN